MNDIRTFGDYLRLKRHERGLSLRKLAAEAGLDMSLISRLESGDRRATDQVLDRLARPLGVAPDDLRAVGQQLPPLAPYLRAKFDLPEAAIAELQAHFEAVRQQYHRGVTGGRS